MSNNSFMPPEILEAFFEDRMDTISRNGNDGLHYRYVEPYSPVTEQDISMSCNCTTPCKKKENEVSEVVDEAIDKGTEAYIRSISDGSTAKYYELPENASELQDLISYRNMNAQVGEAFRALYRLGEGHHSTRERDIKKVIFYMQAELERLDRYESN